MKSYGLRMMVKSFPEQGILTRDTRGHVGYGSTIEVVIGFWSIDVEDRDS